MFAAAKCEAPPAKSENREKSQKTVCAGGASHFEAANIRNYPLLMINSDNYLNERFLDLEHCIVMKLILN